MVNGVYNNDYSYNSYLNNANSIFDVGAAQKAAQEQADKLLAQIEGKGSSSSSDSNVSSLKSDTSRFLDQYVLQMKNLDKSTQALRGGGLDKLLYDKDGKITDDTVKNTISAVEDMVNAYNDTVAFLGKNADRGPGVEKQLARMVRNPVSEEEMKMVGLKMNSDGTLALDKEKLTSALTESGPAQLGMYKDILGGFGGIADATHRNAVAGGNISASSLISNDIAGIQAQKAKENPFIDMYNSIKGSAYLLNNQAATGMLMNMMV